MFFCPTGFFEFELFVNELVETNFFNGTIEVIAKKVIRVGYSEINSRKCSRNSDQFSKNNDKILSNFIPFQHQSILTF